MIFSATSALLSPFSLRLRHGFLPLSFSSPSQFPVSVQARTQLKTSKLFCSQVKVQDETNQGEEEDEACELVNGVDLVIGEGEDAIHAYLLTAVKNNNGSGLILLSDFYGFEDSCTRDFAYRIACNGYNVLVPDLFRKNPFKKTQQKSEFSNWIQTQDPLRVSNDINRSTKWLKDEFKSAGITSNKLGLLGFGYGGARLVEVLARDENYDFATGVCFCGEEMDINLGERIRVPVLFVGGDKDSDCPVSVMEEMKGKIKGAKMVVYSERGHGFVHRPETQEEDKDAENAFGVLRNWLNDKLLVNNDS
ncbi:hypothetical protein LUZ60_001799 [Juncus effusus]|nr:hypothetical protein LUZ60_001799 [Juncus effusus]